MERLKMQLSDTFKAMKQEGLVDDHFTFVYSLKKNVEDHFYVEMIPEFCTEVRDAIKHLTQIIDDQTLNYSLMKNYVYKIKGSSSSFGACRLAVACADFERAIDAASKEGCLQALKRIKREMSALEERLHDCLQIERRIVILAAEKK
ncbi:histidine-containing phosphotransfer protein 2-like [Cajanus cajan]|uniref:histidine-containing phosphotransfer protein 2-like n=1 Tax=Cajanus cajan TaxID=3821 RepID=UPI00098DB70B|nr:histidine-containing phosphotransfer protein 2-like [Cajanus cajan]